MPQASKVPVWCACESCVSTAGTKGKKFPSKTERTAHLLSRAVEKSERSVELSPQSTESASYVFMTTLVTGMDAAQLEEAKPVDIDTIIQGVNRIRLQSGQGDEAEAKIDDTGPAHISTRARNIQDTRSVEKLKNIEKKILRSRELLRTPSTQNVLSVNQELTSARRALVKITRQSEPVDELRTRVQSLLHRTYDEAHQFEHLLPNKQSQPLQFDSSDHFIFPINDLSAPAQISIFLGVVCSVLMGISGRAGDLIMGLINVIVQLLVNKADGSIDPSQTLPLQQIPKSIREALSKFILDGPVTIYAACPKCHFTHEPTFDPGSEIPVYPARCVNRPNPEQGVCGEPLLSPGNDHMLQPSNPFAYPHFADYLAGLLSQHEEIMDKACDDCFESLQEKPTLVNSPFDAEFIRSFPGPDPRLLFVQRPGTEGRYLFVLNVDFFNVEGNRMRGARTSCGILSMACINLPLDIRYQTENMWMCLVPGPVEPQLNDLNHYLRPLVNEMLQSWKDGVQYSRTAGFRTGRKTRSAIAAVVADLPASRKAAGMGSHSSSIYCSVCKQDNRSTLWNTDHDHWTQRDSVTLRKVAEQWRDAATFAERDSIFKMHGIRWSELWRLEYWNPVRQLVTDSMHCILEGLAQHHSRDVLGLSAAQAAEKLKVLPAFDHEFSQIDKNNVPANVAKQVVKTQKLLLAPILGGANIENVKTAFTNLESKLRKISSSALAHVCLDLHLVVHEDLDRQCPSIGEYVAALIKWRHTKPLENNEQPFKITTPEVLQRVNEVIRDTVTPSWVNSVPSNFGYAAAGTIKADEWRTLFTIYIPIALVSIWGEGTTHSSATDASKRREFLDHTMLLVSAITIVFMRTMSTLRATLYLSYIREWVTELHRLHPNIGPRTNNHMAMHIYDFLLLYGPVRSWWCFPFERLIGQIQRLPQNHVFGQLEATLVKTYMRAAKLRRWLSRPDCPPALKECKVLFDRCYAPKSDYSGDGTNHDQQLSFNNERRDKIPSDLRELVPHARPLLRARLRHEGVSYSRASTHLGNSLIMFYQRGNKTRPPIPGIIKYIYSIEDCFYLAVQPHQRPPPSTCDPYRHYPDFPAEIYSSSVGELEVIEVDWVMSHFARWAISPELVVVLTLSKF